MSPESVAIMVLWDAGLIVALWCIATRLHNDMHLGKTPIGEIMRHWVAGMSLFIALLSPWAQAVVIAAVSLSIYVTWGAVSSIRRMPHSDAGPREIPRDAWHSVGGGTARQQQQEPK